MDWKELVKKFPKAMDAFCISKFGGDVKKLMTNGKEDRFWGALSLINDRELYDFFDGHGIEIFIIPFDPGISYEIRVDKLVQRISMDSPVTEERVEMEDFAYIEAFKILEPTL